MTKSLVRACAIAGALLLASPVQAMDRSFFPKEYNPPPLPKALAGKDAVFVPARSFAHVFAVILCQGRVPRAATIQQVDRDGRVINTVSIHYDSNPDQTGINMDRTWDRIDHPTWITLAYEGPALTDRSLKAIKRPGFHFPAQYIVTVNEVYGERETFMKVTTSHAKEETVFK